jgi:hypothetical protein
MTFEDDYRLAVDPETHVAAVATGCEPAGSNAMRSELLLVDLTTGTTTTVFRHGNDLESHFHGWPSMLGGDSPMIGIDAVNHLVLQRSIYCPNPFTIFDVNARPCLNEYDESGHLLKSVPGLFADGFVDPEPVFNGVNGTARLGFAMGQQQIGDGFFSIHSTSVQPYRY